MKNLIRFASVKLVVRMIVFTALLSSFSSAFAEPVFHIAEGTYRSGYDRYVNRSDDDSDFKITGQFIELPLDPNDTSQGNFDLFYRVPGGLDLKKPSVIFFNGGPGSTSADMEFEKHVAGFNFIYFDQRGTGFSHLRTLADEMKSSNFSSRLIARDAESLIKLLGVDRVSVYGHSYGTVPATIFASLFSNETRAVVLEGVVYDGTPELWNSPFRKKVMQNFYDHLEPVFKDRIATLNSSSELDPLWLSRLIRQSMYGAKFADTMHSVFTKLTQLPLADAIDYVQKHSFNQFEFTDDTHAGQIMAMQIGCKELSMGSSDAPWDSVLVNGRFETRLQPEVAQACTEARGQLPVEPYQATQYPLSVPVTYIDGTSDGATAPPNAIHHFENVAKGRAQLILVIDGGHRLLENCVGQSVHPDKNLCDQQDQLSEIASLAFQGQVISQTKLDKLTSFRWKRVTKFRPKIPRS